MDKLLLIGMGGALGSIFRYLFSTGIHRVFGRDFPYGTLAVNAFGSFLIGLLFVILLDRFQALAEQLRALLLIGFLGGFTTFSSFSFETISLLESGELGRSFLNIFLSVSLCLGLTWMGILLGRQL